MVMTLDDYHNKYRFGDLVVTAHFDDNGKFVNYTYELSGNWLTPNLEYIETVMSNDHELANTFRTKARLECDLHYLYIGPYQFEIVDYLFNENVFIVRLIDAK